MIKVSFMHLKGLRIQQSYRCNDRLVCTRHITYRHDMSTARPMPFSRHEVFFEWVGADQWMYQPGKCGNESGQPKHFVPGLDEILDIMASLDHSCRFPIYKVSNGVIDIISGLPSISLGIRSAWAFKSCSTSQWQHT